MKTLKKITAWIYMLLLWSFMAYVIVYKIIYQTIDLAYSLWKIQGVFIGIGVLIVFFLAVYGIIKLAYWAIDQL